MKSVIATFTSASSVNFLRSQSPPICEAFLLSTSYCLLTTNYANVFNALTRASMSSGELYSASVGRTVLS